MWCHLPVTFGFTRSLRFVAPVLLFLAVLATFIFASISQAAPNTNKTINFQGRLQTAAGAVVADGHYNIQFKIYQDGAGTAVGNPGGSLRWTESHTNKNDNQGIEVINGLFSVNLGAKTPFGASVDWDQDTLFLSMNIAGSAAGCSEFGAAPCAADGEMLPMKRITATPYAINAGAIGGKTADNFVQLAQGVQTDASTNTSSIHINKTGTGNILQLQNAGADVFSVTNSGNLEFGSGGNRAIYVGTAAESTTGGNLTLFAGYGGSGSGSQGGGLFLQGGSAGGDNADGGNVAITGGVGTGSGKSGSIYIGANDTSAIQIGSANLSSGNQTIAIGNNNTAGGTTDIVIGSGGGATGGSTTLQAKNTLTIATNGTTRATFSDTTNAVYFGNGITAAAPNDYTIQGTGSSATAVAGGSLTVQGGNATTGDANGGNVVLSGGSGSGAGANGLVVLTTPTFSTVTNDANCYAGGTVVASSCTITAASVNNSSAIIVGFSAPGQTASLPDPTIKTAGRIIYVMAAGGSKDFTLSVNGGGPGSQLPLKQNSAATMLWNGSDWISASGSSSTTLQDAYNNSPQAAGNPDLVVNGGGLTVRGSSSSPSDGPLLAVKGTTDNPLFSINGQPADTTQLVADGTVNSQSAFSSNWSSAGSASIARITSDGFEAGDSAEATAGTSAGNGIVNNLSINPVADTKYRIAVYAKLATGTPLSDLQLRYSPDNGSSFVECTNYNTRTISTSEWTLVTCALTTTAAAVTAAQLSIIQPTAPASARTFMVDALSMTLAPTANANVKVGSGTGSDQATLFTLDKSASAPTATNQDSLLGSMYYDTTAGKVQCYEAEGWGACGSSPDNFVTLSPEYSNAVMHGADVGTISTDLCSDALNINDGSSTQPTICGSNETYNFYKWTTAESTAQSRAIFVTYQLPASFKEFVPGSLSLMARTNNADANASYQVYRNNSTSGLVACGTTVVASTGMQSSWKKATATGSADPSTCNFVAGDSIVIRVNLTAADNANAYVSNLGFTFSNQ